MKLQITCIRKTDRYNPWERIRAVGGHSQGGTRYEFTLEQAISAIQRREHEFFVSVAGKAVEVNVAKSSAGNVYIKTAADGEHPNNLLSLPECP